MARIMSQYLILLASLLYAWVSYEQMIKGNDGLAIMCGGYILISVGMYMVTKCYS